MKRTIESLTPPENTQVMWLDVSQEVKQLKVYINGEWVVVNDDTKNNEEIVSKVLEKIDKDFESYIKKEDADKAYAPKSNLEKKVDKVEGKGLSTEDYTSAEKTKLAGIAEGATKTVVDATLSSISTNPVQNRVITDSLNKTVKLKDAVKSYSEGFSGYIKIFSVSARKARYQTGILNLNVRGRNNAQYNIEIVINTNNGYNNAEVIVAETSVVTRTAEPLYYYVDNSGETTSVEIYYKGTAYDTVSARVTGIDSNMSPEYTFDMELVDALPEGSLVIKNKNAGKANMIYSTPSNATGNPGFRRLEIGDIPDLSSKYLSSIDAMDLLSYGISWKPNVADPIVTRVGNMTYHKTLPIQNNMKGCIAQMKDGVKIMYYLDPTDWRWRENSRGSVLESQSLTATAETYTLTNSIFSTFQYENQWVRINNIPCQVLVIDTSTNTATIKPDSAIDAGTYDVELGAVLNGYDGEVMVEVPEFWIKSWDTDIKREVRISPSKIDDTWEHQPRLLVAAYHDTVLNSIPDNMGYLSTLESNSAISVMNTNSYCRGGNNSSTYDAYITTDKFRSMLGKPRTDISRATMRASARRAGKEMLSYLQYKRVLYWLYFIEYANFNCQATFNSALTSEGYRQGGLGNGVTTVNETYWGYYNSYNPLTPNGYTNEFGNGTNVKAMTIVMPTTGGGDPASSTTQYVPRWHGIENPFGDIWNNVDGIIINSSSIVEAGKNYSEAYATDDSALYSDIDYKSMERVGIELNEGGYVKEWDLGNTAEIIPRLNGGNTTQYKCDYHWISTSTGLRTLILGGNASKGGYAGLGGFSSNYGVGAASASIGFRSSCVVA